MHKNNVALWLHFEKTGERYFKVRTIKAETDVSLNWLLRPLPTQESADFKVSQKELIRFGCIFVVIEKKEEKRKMSA